ncbi:hypothetical protein D4A92_09465 [Rhizobium rosettiformans]|uniref:Phage protein n=1 Tax=Rhizobium rosettiformans TaxID=1368430 RepID=A0ABX7EWA1_9HYPH|nr:hypothetical protein [Rhizobium rosettiformans]QRF51646.1 hypothetical protein D4A92_09465 [Rhizobium rosettiformans]
MSKKIQIICTTPGMRRNGVKHPATAFYKEGHWTEEQLAAFRADPAFTVREVGEGENVQTEDDFQQRVNDAVQVLVEQKIAELQAAFDQAVAEKAKEKIEELQGEHDKAVADLNAKLDAATKVAGDQAAKAKK